MDKVHSTLAVVALKEAFIKDTPLHHNLVKHDIKDINDALSKLKDTLG